MVALVCTFFPAQMSGAACAGGRLAFLLPADVCEGIRRLHFWNRICQQYRLVAAVTFADEAAPFPTVDTNAMVFLFTKSEALGRFPLAARVRKRRRSNFCRTEWTRVFKRRELFTTAKLVEALKTGLSAPAKNAK